MSAISPNATTRCTPPPSPPTAGRHLVDVHVLLIRDNEVLLTQRRDTNPDFNGRWHLPSGKLDAGESVLVAATREAEEEVGVLVDPAGLRHVHTIHVNGSGPEPRLGLFFETRRWIGEPANREPDKCSAIGWFRLDALPGQLIEYPAAAIHAYRQDITFSMLGWIAQTTAIGSTPRYPQVKAPRPTQEVYGGGCVSL